MEELVSVDVGGEIVKTYKEKLLKLPLFAGLFQDIPDDNIPFFIDRDPRGLRAVLNWLDTDEYDPEYSRDFEYYGIDIDIFKDSAETHNRYEKALNPSSIVVPLFYFAHPKIQERLYSTTFIKVYKDCTTRFVLPGFEHYSKIEIITDCPVEEIRLMANHDDLISNTYRKEDGNKYTLDLNCIYPQYSSLEIRLTFYSEGFTSQDWTAICHYGFINKRKELLDGYIKSFPNTHTFEITNSFELGYKTCTMHHIEEPITVEFNAFKEGNPVNIEFINIQWESQTFCQSPDQLIRNHYQDGTIFEPVGAKNFDKCIVKVTIYKQCLFQNGCIARMFSKDNGI